jgi:hypothetical protein
MSDAVKIALIEHLGAILTGVGMVVIAIGTTVTGIFTALSARKMATKDDTAEIHKAVNSNFAEQRERLIASEARERETMAALMLLTGQSGREAGYIAGQREQIEKEKAG